jgi:single-strand DNA-binding protein
MSDVNQSFLIGRLVRDANFSSTTNGTAITKFSLAVNKKRKAGDEWKDKADFFEIVVWGKLGESLLPYLNKGKQIAVVGELNQERWSGDDGQNHSKVTATAQFIQLLGGNSNSGDNGSRPSEKNNPPQTAAADDGFADDIPF